jgi:HEAT repeat protein
LQEKNNFRRITSAHALGKIGEKAVSAVPALIQALQDNNDFVKIESAFALGKIGEKAVSAVPALIQVLQKKNFVKKESSYFDPEKFDSLEWSKKFNLLDKSSFVKSGCAWALGQIGEKASEAIPELILSLQDEKHYVRQPSAWALGKMGEKAVNAIPALIFALQDKDAEVIEDSLEAIENIGEKIAVTPVLVLALQHVSEAILWQGIENCQHFGITKKTS